ncbi:MAG: DUF4919 domain-containing protein [Nitrosomonas ureae]
MTLTDSLVKFLQNQTLLNFLELRLQVLQCENFSPYANYEAVADSFFIQERFQEGATALQKFLPGNMLSFGLHSLLAYAYQKIGTIEEVQREISLAQAVMNGLLTTGDGSELHPYEITQISDEYDILRYLGKSSRNQMLVRTNDQIFDKHTCEDGTEIWFDITLPFNARFPQILNEAI